MGLFLNDSRLIKTSIKFKINNSLFNWLKVFLYEKTQGVVISQTFLEFIPLLSGVPQCEVIDPLLFIIHINDIVLEVDVLSNINIFVDDTKIFGQSNKIYSLL